MKLNTLRTVFGAALFGAVVSAQAATVNLTGWANGYETVSVGSPAHTGAAGGFVGKLSGAGSFDANPFYTYCVELVESFSLPSGDMTGYAVTAGAAYFDSKSAPDLISGTTIVGRLGKLFTYLSANGLSALTSTTTSVAIQLAVWESIYEGTSAPSLTLGSGGFKSNWSGASVTKANELLAGAATTTSLYSISVIAKAGSQDFILLQRVPEPASLALVGLALAGLAFTRRRT